METRKLLLLLVAFSFLVRLGQARPPSVARRHRRAVKPTGGRIPTVSELRFQCCNHGWSECCNTTYLTESNSYLNRYVRQCITTAQNQLPNVIPIDIEVTDVLQQERGEQATSDPGRDKRETEEGEGGEDDGVQGEGEQTQQTTGCRLSKAQKGVAREHYCQYLQLIDILMHLRVMDELRRTAPCVRFDANSNYVPPIEILKGIDAWHKWMTSRIRCCTFLGHIVPWTPPSRHDQQELQLDEWEATWLWSQQLARVMDMMHMFDLMTGLGRRKTCLRGCVNVDEVDCCNLLPYEILD